MGQSPGKCQATPLQRTCRYWVVTEKLLWLAIVAATTTTTTSSFLPETSSADSSSSSSSAPAGCSLPIFSTGALLNSSTDLTRFVKKHRHVLVGFSAASCAECCQWESVYAETLELLPTGVKWVRVDMDRLEAKALAATHDLSTLPGVVFFNERRATKLLELQRPSSLVGLVQRSLVPLPILGGGAASSSAEAFSAWLDLTEPFFRPTAAAKTSELQLAQLIRVLALPGVKADLSEDGEDTEELLEAAKAWSGRPTTVRFARGAGKAIRGVVAQHSLLSAECAIQLRQGHALLLTAALFDGEYVEDGPRFRISAASAENQSAVPVLLPAVLPQGYVFNASLAGGQQLEAAEGGGSGSAKLKGPLVPGSVLPRVSCRLLDAYDGLSVEQWVLRSSLPAVGRFDGVTSGMYERTQKPILLLFVDPQRPELASWLRLLHAVHLRINRADFEGGDGLRVLFTYIDGSSHLHRMTSLGLAADARRMPALCFNFVTEQVLTWQPAAESYADSSAVLTEAVVGSLVDRFIRGDGQQLKEDTSLLPQASLVPKRDPSKGEQRVVPPLSSLSLEDRLRFVQKMNLESFSELVMDSSKDVLVFFYASSGQAAAASADRAIHVNRCAERLAELGVASVRVARLDLAESSAPSSVQISEVPSLVLFPAFAKDPPYQVFRGTQRSQHIMWWIQELSSLKFELPRLPHLDELETKEYWKQKAQLDSDGQRRAASNNERPSSGKGVRKGARSVAAEL